MLSEFSDFFRTPYVDQHAKEVPKNIVFWGAPFHWHVNLLRPLKTPCAGCFSYRITIFLQPLRIRASDTPLDSMPHQNQLSCHSANADDMHDVCICL